MSALAANTRNTTGKVEGQKPTDIEAKCQRLIKIKTQDKKMDSKSWRPRQKDQV